MRIGFDGKRALHNKRGLGNYSNSLLAALLQYHKENDYFLYSPVSDSLKRKQMSYLNNPSCHMRTPQSICWKYFPSLWRGKGVVKDIQQDTLDIYHGLSQELPQGIEKLPICRIVSIHDLLCVRFPNNFGKINAKIYRYKIEKACKIAHKVIAVSKQSKKDLIDLLKIESSKIEVIYPICQNSFYKKYSEEKKFKIARKYQLPSKYILYVGAFEKNKNVMNLVKAYKEYLKHGGTYSLILIGKKNTYRNKVEEYIKENHLEKETIFLEDIEQENLAIIFQLASLFVYPSIFEGFGIPVAEALCSAVPVITSQSSSLPEAGGKGALYVDPDNIQDLANKIKKILSNASLKEELVWNGIKHAEQFKEEKIVKILMDSYQRTIECWRSKQKNTRRTITFF